MKFCFRLVLYTSYILYTTYTYCIYLSLSGMQIVGLPEPGIMDNGTVVRRRRLVRGAQDASPHPSHLAMLGSHPSIQVAYLHLQLG